MDIETFLLERNQTLYENTVQLNLTESGVHPCSIRTLLTDAEIETLLSAPLGYGYTDGTPLLRDRIAAWYPGATAANVAVTHGASEANLVAVLSLLSPGDELLFIAPNFMQLPGLARSMGVTVKTFALSADQGWQPDIDRLAAAVGPRTRMIALVNPNNPTGIVQTKESMAGVVDVARRGGAYLLSDEIYRGAEIDRGETPTYYGLYDRVIVTSSLSKAFALPGLRLGWLVGPEGVVAETWRRQDYTTIGTSRLSQLLAEKAMDPPMRERLLARSRAILSANSKLIADWMSRNARHFTWVKPEAGGMAFLGYSLPLTSEQFSAKLREEEGVFVAAGSWFGLEGHIRIGVGVESEALEEALARIELFAKRWSAADASQPERTW